MNLPKHAHPIEREILQTLVNRITSFDCDISVWDGEEYSIRRSIVPEDILSAMSHTGIDCLQICDDGISEKDNAYEGSITVIYGNEPENIIADYSSVEWLTTEIEAITNKYS